MKQEPDIKFEPTREDLDSWNQWTQSWHLDTSKCRDLDSAMQLLACLADEYEARQIDRIPCQIYHLALDWLATLKNRIEAVKAIIYTSGLAGSDGQLIEGTTSERCMLYNTNTINDQEAETLLQHGLQDTDPRVVDLWMEQAFALFPNLAGEPDQDRSR